MHILHISPYYAPAFAFGGVPRAVEGLARAQAERGHRVTVITTDAGTQTARLAAPAHETRDGVRVIRVPNLSVWARGRFNMSSPLSIGRAARAILPTVDIVHCHEFRTVENLLITPLVAHAGIPLVLSPHGTLNLTTGRGSLKAAWDRLLSPSVAPRFAAILCLTETERAEAQAVWAGLGTIALPQWAVIPNGVALDMRGRAALRAAFRAQYQLGDAPVCLFLGRLHPRKGVEVLVRAFQQADAPDARLVIAGPDEGALATILPLIEHDSRITLTGYLDNDARLGAWAAADVFALPATGEGLSMAALEALAVGVPVLLSPGCNLPEAADYDAGLIVEPQVEPLAAALWLLLTDPLRRADMGVKAAALAAQRFSWSAVAAAVERVYGGIRG